MIALYERYAASIFAYARLHTPSWEDAEDLTLEVFTALLVGTLILVLHLAQQSRTGGQTMPSNQV